MNLEDTNVETSPTEATAPWKSSRRMIDAGGVALFHLAIFGVIILASPKSAHIMPIMAGAVLGIDAVLFFSRPKRKPILDPETAPAHPQKYMPLTSFAVEFFVLLVPPALLIGWFLWIIWEHQTLSRNQLIGVLVGIPAVVGVVSRIIYLRMTRVHVGIQNNATQFIGLSMIATWIVSTILFIVLGLCLLLRWKKF